MQTAWCTSQAWWLGGWEWWWTLFHPVSLSPLLSNLVLQPDTTGSHVLFLSVLCFDKCSCCWLECFPCQCLVPTCLLSEPEPSVLLPEASLAVQEEMGPFSPLALQCGFYSWHSPSFLSHFASMRLIPISLLLWRHWDCALCICITPGLKVLWIFNLQFLRGWTNYQWGSPHLDVIGPGTNPRCE